MASYDKLLGEPLLHKHKTGDISDYPATLDTRYIKFEDITYTNKWFVSDDIGDDTNDGASEATPFATIDMALEGCSEGDLIDVLDSNTYTLTSPLIIPNNVTVNMPYAKLAGEIVLGTSSRFIAKSHYPSDDEQTMVSCIGTAGSAYTVYGMNSTGYSDTIHFKPAAVGGYIVAQCKHITVGTSTSGHENIMVYSSAGSTGVNIATDQAKFSSDKALNYGYPADLVYGDTGYCQWYTDVVGLPVTVTYDIGTGTTVTSYKMKATSSGTRMPKNWKLYGQLADAGWTELDSQTDITWDSYEEKEFSIGTPGSYDEYKIEIASSTHATRLQIDDVALIAGVASIAGDVMVSADILSLGEYAQGILSHDSAQRVVTNFNNVYQIAGTSNATFIVISDGTVSHTGEIATANTLWTKTGGTLLWSVTFDNGTKTGSADYYHLRNTDFIHNSLSGLQGGTTDEYYHLTSAQHTDLNAHLTDYTNPHQVTAAQISAKEVLTSTNSWYVDYINGNDTTGDGSVGNPFKTIQGAVDIVATYDNGGYDQTIQLVDNYSAQSATRARSSNVVTITTGSAHGLTTGNSCAILGFDLNGYDAVNKTITVVDSTTFTYSLTGADEGSTADTNGFVYKMSALHPGFEAKSFTGAGRIRISGNSSNNSYCLMYNASGIMIDQTAVIGTYRHEYYAIYHSSTFAFQTLKSSVEVDNIMVYRGGIALFYFTTQTLGQLTNIYLSGNATYIFFSSSATNLRMNAATVTIMKPITCTYFTFAQFGYIFAGGMTFVNPSNVTGRKYEVQQNGVMNTGGGGINYFPGTTAGTTSTGGQYL